MNRNGEGPVLLPAKQFNVWSRLYKRFLLEPAPAVGSNAYVAPVIQPVTDSDALLRTPEVRTFTVSLTSAITFVMANVPQGERWTLLFMRMRLSGGTWTHNELIVGEAAGGDSIQVKEYAQSSTSETFEPRTPFVLDEDWDIIVNVNTHSVTGNGVLQVWILVEKAF